MQSRTRGEGRRTSFEVVWLPIGGEGDRVWISRLRSPLAIGCCTSPEQENSKSYLLLWIHTIPEKRRKSRVAWHTSRLCSVFTNQEKIGDHGQSPLIFAAQEVDSTFVLMIEIPSWRQSPLLFLAHGQDFELEKKVPFLSFLLKQSGNEKRNGRDPFFFIHLMPFRTHVLSGPFPQRGLRRGFPYIN